MEIIYGITLICLAIWPIITLKAISVCLGIFFLALGTSSISRGL